MMQLSITKFFGRGVGEGRGRWEEGRDRASESKLLAM
jgi:hypothetical protein